MDRRANIAIPFNYDEGWIGGAHYVLSLVTSFNLLPPSQRPDVWLLAHDKHSFSFIRDGSNYRRLRWLPPRRIKNIDGGLTRKIKRLSRLTPWFLKRQMSFDIVFPSPIDSFEQRTVCWIPDLQEKHLPQFFDRKELETRERQHRYYIDHFKHIVFSSEAARSDFHRFYPEATTHTHVVHFAVFPHTRTALTIEDVRRKHGLEGRYFMCPNQFWIHKNHATVIEAVALAASRGTRVTMVFSGKEHDHRAPGHAETLKKLVAERGLTDRIRFLGFLPRDEQLVLFENAIAIVQPSLFEGWSTAIEEAKALSKFVIASDLAVNREQLAQNAAFFPATDAGALAALLMKFKDIDPKCEAINYKRNQYAFAQNFMRVVDAVHRGPMPVFPQEREQRAAQ